MTDVAEIAKGLTEAQRRRAKNFAAEMPKDARRCILNFGDKKTPVPDSVWLGKYSEVLWSAGPARFALSPFGLAVRSYLATIADAEG